MFVFAFGIKPLYQYMIVLDRKRSVIHTKDLVGVVFLRLRLPVYPVPVLVVFPYLEPLLYLVRTLGTERIVHLGSDGVEDELPAYCVLGVVGEILQEALAGQHQ